MIPFRKSIKAHIFLYLLFFAVLPIALLGTYIIINKTKESYERSISIYSEELKIKDSQIIRPYFSFIKEDLAFLSTSRPLTSLVEALPGGNPDQLKLLKDDLASLLLGFGNNMMGYMQIRFIDGKGKEIVRVDFDGQNGRVVPDVDLQDKSNRPYFTETMERDKGETYVSPMDLNREAGKIEEPFKPTIRFATPLFDRSGIRRGVLVANLNAGKILEQFRENIREGEIYLVNEEGYFLAHPEREKEWGFETGHEEETLSKYFPEFSSKIFSWANEKSLKESIFTFEQEGKILLAYPAFPFGKDKEKFFVAVRMIPKDVALARSREGMEIIILVISILLLSSIPIAYFAGRKIARPIEILDSAALKISDGDLSQRIPVVAEDEIGELAMSFNKMTENLQISYAGLENKVAERTEDLRLTNENLKNKTNELEILNEELLRANAYKTQFLANMSHELRTPLNSVIGFSELLKQKAFGELNEKQDEYIDFIHSSGKHLLDLINNVLDISKVEAGKMQLDIETLSFKNLIGEVLGTLKPLAIKKRLKLESETEGEDFDIIKADRRKLKQVLLNLVSNAIKFTSSGVICVKVAFEDKPVSGDESSSHSTFLKVLVKDTGMGIKVDDQERIFQEFVQVDASLTRKEGGTGLGLALSKSFIELHGGRIWVESELNQGATFAFLIPVKIEQEKEVKEFPVERISSDKKIDKEDEEFPLILVVEDDKGIAELLKEYITRGGYRVEVARDGEEALSLAKKLKPFCITLDLMLPKKDGWQVLKELKDDPETTDIPVTIVSALNDKELGFSLGAVDYLPKPVSQDAILKVLRRHSYTSKVRRWAFTILLIDDDPKCVEILSANLEKEGFGVLKAYGGKEGINLAIEREPDIIILDLMMPEVSGFEVIKNLKKHPTAKDIPIILCTAKDLSQDEKDLLEKDIEKVMTKGAFNADNLLQELSKLEMLYPVSAKMIDPLTMAFNHRYYKKRIAQEISRAERYGGSFSLIMLNIDNFKDYNNRWGFPSGDEVLKDIVAMIKDSSRKSDCIIRYDGNKFLLIFPHTPKDAAQSAKEKIKMRIQRKSFPTRKGRKGKVSVSGSVVSYPQDGKEKNILISKITDDLKKNF